MTMPPPPSPSLPGQRPLMEYHQQVLKRTQLAAALHRAQSRAQPQGNSGHMSRSVHRGAGNASAASAGRASRGVSEDAKRDK